MRASFRSIAAAATLAAVAVLAACATSAPPTTLYKSSDYLKAQKAEAAGADPSKLMICEQTMMTGSHIPTKHCWSKMEMDTARERAQQTAAQQQRLDR